MVKHCENKKQPYYWFVVGIPSEFVSWDDEIPTMMGKKNTIHVPNHQPV
jgi:hypothetical protein